MRLTLFVVFAVFLVGCSHQAQPNGERVYSYVDGQGHLVQGRLSAKQATSPDQQEPRLYTYQDAQGQLVQGELPSEGKPVLQAPVDATDKTYQTPEQAEAKQEELARDRFVTHFDANGYLVREKIDPVAARAYRQAEKEKKDYQELAVQAAQQARDRQYAETFTAIPADCCLAILPHAEKLKTGKEQSLHFIAGEYGWIQLEAAHPAHVYALDAKAGRLLVKSYKHAETYLHPYLLFLDQAGTPILAVNDLFERRYPETWYRYGFVEGAVPVPSGSAFVVVYLPYETGSRVRGMEPMKSAQVAAEPDAKPAGRGDLLLQMLPN